MKDMLKAFKGGEFDGFYKHFDFSMEFREDELISIDVLSDIMFPAKFVDCDDHSSYMNFVALGFYMGQILIQNVPFTEWSPVEEVKYITDYQIFVSKSAKGRAVLNPFSSLQKCINDPKKRNVEAWYRGFKSMLTNEELPEGVLILTGQAKVNK